MMLPTRLLTAIALAIVTSSANADIIQSQSSIAFSFPGNTPFGQSFTATANEPNVETLSFMWGPTPFPRPNHVDPIFTARLHQGAGYSGTVLAEVTIPAIPNFSTPNATWIDFTFANPVNLTVGEVYTIHFSPQQNFVYGSYFVRRPPSVYAGGNYFIENGEPAPESDLTFRVLASTVPEPSSLMLIGSALIAFASRRRRLA